MNNPTRLHKEEVYVIDGVTLTGEDIIDAVIDAAFLKGKLSDMISRERQ